jgi:CDP-diacylglycerol---serine O-phosphatidyltransferase
MSPVAPDSSRDRRIEDPTNLWIIHPLARSLLPSFLAAGVSANAVSIGGLVLGALAAIAYANWRIWPFACVGLLLSIAWLVADGLDGMIARATATASPLGRFLDGLCDHGVFLLIYLALAASIGSLEAWVLASCAGVVHAVQSNFYESERARFHRRCRGVATATLATGPNALVRLYDRISGVVDRLAVRFDHVLGRNRDPLQLGAVYGAEAAKPLRLMSLLSANTRVYVIFLACIVRAPSLFWWAEIVVMDAILAFGLWWHRRVESRLVGNFAPAPRSSPSSPPTLSKDVTN